MRYVHGKKTIEEFKVYDTQKPEVIVQLIFIKIIEI